MIEDILLLTSIQLSNKEFTRAIKQSKQYGDGRVCVVDFAKQLI